MSLLKEARPEMAYLKMGIYGEAGSGKTFTSSKVAIGLHQYIKANKPVAFLDTETGSDFMIPIFKQAKIKFLVAKTRAFKDLIDILDDAEKNCSIFIIDSITHIWNEVCDSFCDAHNISMLTVNHWRPIKKKWKGFTDRFINSKLHIIMAGRSADKWQYIEDEQGAKELQKVGTKMRAETQIGYEPSLLIEMEQINKSPKTGSGWIHRAWVIKDRWNEQTKMEGKPFDNPIFDIFLPHIELLNLGGEHRAIDLTRTSNDLFKGSQENAEKQRKRQILLEEIKGEILLLYPGLDAESKKKKAELFKEVFSTTSWTNIEGMVLDDLENGLKTIKKKTDKIKKEKK